MNERSFQMRLSSRYEGSENTLADLKVEVFEDGEWQDFDLGIRSPGFLIFVYAALTCQHLYLRTNAAERGLMLESAEGTMRMITTEDWDLQTIQANFEAKLRSGSPKAQDMDHIIERMKACPVSRNIKDGAAKETTVRFV